MYIVIPWLLGRDYFALDHAIPGHNFIELLKQKILLNKYLLSRNEQNASYKLYRLGSLAGNLFLVSNVLLRLATFVLKQPYEIGP